MTLEEATEILAAAQRPDDIYRKAPFCSRDMHKRFAPSRRLVRKALKALKVIEEKGGNCDIERR